MNPRTMGTRAHSLSWTVTPISRIAFQLRTRLLFLLKPLFVTSWEHPSQKGFITTARLNWKRHAKHCAFCMTPRLQIVQKRMVLLSVLSGECARGLVLFCCKAAFRTDGGPKLRNVTACFAMFASPRQLLMLLPHISCATRWISKAKSSLLEPWFNTNPLRNDKLNF